VLQRLRTLRQNESGFTLTELLIVIVILGILTGVVVLAVGAFTDRGESAACRADKKSLESAIEAYRAKESRFPPALVDLTPDYLRSLPTSTKYTFSYTAAGGPNGNPPPGTLRVTVVGNAFTC
jgi:prepilin-type N-terminal cleavage/methylation domain-containing protein